MSDDVKRALLDEAQKHADDDHAAEIDEWKPPRPRCLAHHQDEPCPTCAAYIAAGL